MLSSILFGGKNGNHIGRRKDIIHNKILRYPWKPNRMQPSCDSKKPENRNRTPEQAPSFHEFREQQRAGG
jgi:hypothetical protein